MFSSLVLHMFSFKRKYFLTALLFISINIYAQYDAHFSHYWAVENLYNPAAMNKNSKLNITGSYSMQMLGYTRAPGSMYFGANTVLPFDRGRHSGAIILMNENIGLFSHKRLLANYAFKFKIGNGWLNLGVQGGVMNEGFEYDELELIDKNDPAFPTSGADGSGADMGAGLYYYNRGYYIGISALHLNSPRVYYSKDGDKSAYLDIKPTFYSIGGCNIQLNNPLLSLQPCFQVATDGKFVRTDITIRGSYEYESSKFFGGFTYSPGTSVAVLIGGMYKQVTIGYAYELFTSGVGAINGSHDLIVSYSMDVDFFKKGKNVHKSVRYL